MHILQKDDFESSRRVILQLRHCGQMILLAVKVPAGSCAAMVIPVGLERLGTIATTGLGMDAAGCTGGYRPAPGTNATGAQPPLRSLWNGADLALLRCGKKTSCGMSGRRSAQQNPRFEALFQKVERFADGFGILGNQAFTVPLRFAIAPQTFRCRPLEVLNKPAQKGFGRIQATFIVTPPPLMTRYQGTGIHTLDSS